MKKVKLTLAVFISFLVVIGSAHLVWAQEGSDFSVTPLIGENQVGQYLGYFNFLLFKLHTRTSTFKFGF
jgi:flagellar biosynthesis protein FliR